MVFCTSKDQLPLSCSTQYPVTGARSFGYDGSNNMTEYPYGANPEAGKWAQVNGIKIYYEIYGQGHPLLLLHGNGQAIGEYEQQIEFCKKDYQVIAVDTRGQGRSTTDSTHYTYHLFAKDTSSKAPNDIRLMHLLEEEPNMRFEDLRTIHCPVLVMAGENDLIKEQHTKGIAQHITRAQLLIFPKGTHYIPQENAKLFNNTVLDFLKQ
ncbi:alpha/beta fold hydrolase [Paraflavitalea speifideaquila]|uniref:alpha/beta fold hydrolase n=1 Tax=Paraflavitalea speifideaquila TaxID=3076558 RepID=UPI0028EAABED|nr:alpha/beta fold hydrolase [Paraflavitalea speifideiaquila]